MLKLFFENLAVLSGLKPSCLISSAKIPPKMKELYNSRIHQEMNPKWKAGWMSYLGVAKDLNGMVIVKFNLFGNVKTVSRQIDWSDLPESIIRRLTKELSGTSFKHALKIVYPRKFKLSDKHEFEILIKKRFTFYRLYFSSKGILLHRHIRNIIT